MRKNYSAIPLIYVTEVAFALDFKILVAQLVKWGEVIDEEISLVA